VLYEIEGLPVSENRAHLRLRREHRLDAASPRPHRAREDCERGYSMSDLRWLDDAEDRGAPRSGAHSTRASASRTPRCGSGASGPAFGSGAHVP
jgi:hypothetical protein